MSTLKKEVEKVLEELDATTQQAIKDVVQVAHTQAQEAIKGLEKEIGQMCA